MPNLWWVARVLVFPKAHDSRDWDRSGDVFYDPTLGVLLSFFCIPLFTYSVVGEAYRGPWKPGGGDHWPSWKLITIGSLKVLLFLEVLTVSKNSFSLHKTYIVLCGSKDDFSRFFPFMWVYKVNLVLWITFLFLLKNYRVSNWKNGNLKM